MIAAYSKPYKPPKEFTDEKTYSRSNYDPKSVRLQARKI